MERLGLRRVASTKLALRQLVQHLNVLSLIDEFDEDQFLNQEEYIEMLNELP